MSRTRFPGTMRTRHHEPHLPGFIKHPPTFCECNQIVRQGIVCVDVLSCKSYCNDVNCDAIENYLDGAHRLMISTRPEKEEDK